MYNTPPVGGVGAGFGGAAITAPWLGVQAIWLGLALFTLLSTALAVKRILPTRKRIEPLSAAPVSEG
ncbi:hypothetical protein ETD83_15460 [Actinomadura soli]|uniref:Uncharacterized protein n=1 Tax=Actinomadura soli TaxID=2508997 RepID=A0A5C4JC83_9ACTN|nr:hypothetical protein [Actinomadura soli]TMR01113.1 hypothetical protein ETD83_15460 [Actinomadura soli]